MRSRLLMACVRRDQSLTELARELDQPLGKLHYHVRRLMACGLLTVERTEQRPGRPIRYYRAIAQSFLVSMADAAEPMGEKWNRELRQSMIRQFNRKNLSEMHELDAAGRYRVRLVDPDSRGQSVRSSFDFWKVLRLTNQQRCSLAAELGALISRYDGKGEGSDHRSFIVHAAFAPKMRNA